MGRIVTWLLGVFDIFKCIGCGKYFKYEPGGLFFCNKCHDYFDESFGLPDQPIGGDNE